MKDFFIFVGDMWGDLSLRQRISVSIIVGVFIVVVIF